MKKLIVGLLVTALVLPLLGVGFSYENEDMLVDLHSVDEVYAEHLHESEADGQLVPADAPERASTHIVSNEDELSELLTGDALSSGDTVKLGAGFTCNTGINIENKNLTLDLNGFVLNVICKNSTGIILNSSNVSLMGNGEFNVAGFVGVSAVNSAIELTSVTGTDSAGVIANNGNVRVRGGVLGALGGVYADNSSRVTVDNDVLATGESGDGVAAYNGGRVVVKGKVSAPTRGVYADGVGSAVEVMGDVCGESTDGVQLTNGGSATVHGNIRGAGGVCVYGGNAIVHGSVDVNNNNDKVHCFGVYVKGAASIATIAGDIASSGINTSAVGAYDEGNVTINGNVAFNGVRGNGVNAYDGGNVTIDGNVFINSTSPGGSGVIAYNGGSAMVKGDVHATENGVSAQGAGSAVHVSGNVKGSNFGVEATEGSNVTVAGDVQGGSGVHAIRSSVEVAGNVSADSGEAAVGIYPNVNGIITVGNDVRSSGYGVFADADGGKATINGVITAPVYIYFGNNKNVNDYSPETTKPGYREYTNNKSFVWVKGLIDTPTAPLSTPKNLKPQSASYNSIKLTWSKVADASGYYIYRSESKSGSYSNIKKLGASSASYTDTSLTTGKAYYYKIVAYKTSSGATVKSKASAAVGATPKVAKPGAFKATTTLDGKIKLSWAKPPGATGYYIYRASSKTGAYTKIKTITNGNTLSFTNSSLAPGKTCYYKILPYRSAAGKTVKGMSAGPVAGKTRSA